jgi:hypothetical protein
MDKKQKIMRKFEIAGHSQKYALYYRNTTGNYR